MGNLQKLMAGKGIILTMIQRDIWDRAEADDQQLYDFKTHILVNVQGCRSVAE